MGLVRWDLAGWGLVEALALALGMVLEQGNQALVDS